MGYINYTPTRSLIGSSDGKLHPTFQRFSTKHNDDSITTESLDGSNVETTYLGRVKKHTLISDPIELSLWPKWEEFWHSVAGGENFTIDAAGTEGDPNNAITVKFVPNSWKESDPGPRHRVFEFEIRVV